MKEIGILPKAQASVLLDEIGRQRDDECRTIIETAEQEANMILRQARREARLNVHEAIERLRDEAGRRLAQAKAELDTESRMHAQERAVMTLGKGWPILVRALHERWRSSSSARSIWTMQAALFARERLIEKKWTIAHPVGWDANEQRLLADVLQDVTDVQVTFSADSGIEAGLRFEAGGATVDATPESLLADRAGIEALLLAEIESLKNTSPAEHRAERGAK